MMVNLLEHTGPSVPMAGKSTMQLYGNMQPHRLIGCMRRLNNNVLLLLREDVQPHVELVSGWLTRCDSKIKETCLDNLFS